MDEEGEIEACPMSETLQEQMITFHSQLVKMVGCLPKEEETDQVTVMPYPAMMDDSF